MLPTRAAFLRAAIKAGRLNPPPPAAKGEYICPICLDGEPCSPFIRTPCGHYIGKWCALQNVEIRNTCPTCRAELFDRAEIPPAASSDDAPDHEDLITPEAFEETRWLESIAMAEAAAGGRRNVVGTVVPGDSQSVRPRPARRDEMDAFRRGGQTWPDLTQQQPGESSRQIGGASDDRILRWLDDTGPSGVLNAHQEDDRGFGVRQRDDEEVDRHIITSVRYFPAPQSRQHLLPLREESPAAYQPRPPLTQPARQTQREDANRSDMRPRRSRHDPHEVATRERIERPRAYQSTPLLRQPVGQDTRNRRPPLRERRTMHEPASQQDQPVRYTRSQWGMPLRSPGPQSPDSRLPVRQPAPQQQIRNRPVVEELARQGTRESSGWVEVSRSITASSPAERRRSRAEMRGRNASSRDSRERRFVRTVGHAIVRGAWNRFEDWMYDRFDDDQGR